ncbi:hypothetical protein [Scytonema hofmannii]|uniref:hypothetical protein n=1 Tax=Scytonema hofmannii TaxID=34078 RepID=UPI00034D1119|nr:hypothetical protein [Scytonema hofmannii]
MQDREILQLWKSLFPRISETNSKINVKLRGQAYAINKPKTETKTTTKRYLGYGR